MRICVAQTRSFKGDIQQNIEHHKKMITLALSCRADTIIFPELSITGYEPDLAKDLATHPDDSRLDDFQTISDTRGITIGVGVPVRSNTGIYISMILYSPQQSKQIYSKKYIHADEEPFFIRGQNSLEVIENTHMALAICYELSVPQHAENAFKIGADIYMASVAKSVSGMDKACKRLAEIASTYSMTVFMSNCVGYCDNFECGGKTSIWNNKGILLGQLNNTDEGILLLDTHTQELIEKTL